MLESTAVSVAHPPRNHLDSLTGLRFVAAIYVFLFHFGAGFMTRAGAPAPVVRFFENGYVGVSLFFVLSGFILTYTYRQGVSSIGRFALARFARIYPIYAFALLIALPYVYQQLDLIGIAKVLAMVQSWAWPASTSGNTWITQAWTLSVEAVFYISFPILIAGINRLSVRGLAGSVGLVVALIVMLGPQSLHPGVHRSDLPAWVQVIPLPLLRLPEFIFGMLVCRLFLARGPAGVDQAGRMASVPVAVVLLALLALLSSHEEEASHQLALVVPLFGLLIYFLPRAKTTLSRLLSGPVMLRLGGASYALYLIQVPVRQMVKSAIPNDSIGQIINPFVLIAVSLAAYYLIENPCRSKILSFASRRSSSTIGKQAAP